MPPALYKDKELSLEEVIRITKKDIDVLKAVVNITTEKNGIPHASVYASLLLKRPNWLHMRMYKFGMPVGDFLVKDNVVHTVSGKGAKNVKEYGKELYHAVFWWEDIQNAAMYKQAESYIIRAQEREIHLDSATLLPQSQMIQVNDRYVHIIYGEPKKKVVLLPESLLESDMWYPSVLKIHMGPYMIHVVIEKLLINPPLSESDFQHQ
jgi:hypothetical protein